MRTLCSNVIPAIVVSLGLWLSATSVLLADQEPKSPSDEKPGVTKIGGLFEAVEAHEVAARTEQVDALEIKKIVPHGIRVKRGQNLIWFETEDLDKKIKDAETDLRLAKLALDKDEFEHQQFMETQKLDRAAAERTRKEAQQDFDNFVQVDRQREAKSAEFNLKSSRASLENAMEELQQLQQMYEEDDLTEESEEIVLKRAKRAVEFAQHRLEGTEIQSERTVNQGIPRSQAKNDDTLARAQLAYQKSLQDLASTRQRREIELRRKRDKFTEQQEKLNELKEERRRIVLTSPIDGIVLHGKLTRGRISDKPSVLDEGSKVTPQQVLATVVDPRRLQIRVDLEEKHLSLATPGAKCTVKAKALPEFEAAGTIKSVSLVPYAGAKYDCIATFRASRQQPAILPTMTCELQFAVKDGDSDDAKKDGKNEQAAKEKKKEAGAKKKKQGKPANDD